MAHPRTRHGLARISTDSPYFPGPSQEYNESEAMGTFGSFRDGAWNTYYASERHRASVYVTHAIIGYLSATVAVCLLIVVAGSRGQERLSPLLRLMFNLHTAVTILLSLTGQDWAVASMHTLCDYSTSLGAKIQASVGLHVGLKSVNITLTAGHNSSSQVWDIHYNERFSFAGSADVEWGVVEARRRGLPHVVLYVAEYLEQDSGGLRWTRILRAAGHFVYIILWAGLVAWLVAQVLVSFVITRGELLNAVCGSMMLGACLLYHLLQPAAPLIVPFQDGFLQLHYGWCFWLCLASGLATLLYSLVVVTLRRWRPLCVAEIFLNDASGETDDAAERNSMAPLQIMTPYQVRKKKHDLYKSIFDNKAFSQDSDMSTRVRQTISLPPNYSLTKSTRHRQSVLDQCLFESEVVIEAECTPCDIPFRTTDRGEMDMTQEDRSQSGVAPGEGGDKYSESCHVYPPPDYSSGSDCEPDPPSASVAAARQQE